MVHPVPCLARLVLAGNVPLGAQTVRQYFPPVLPRKLCAQQSRTIVLRTKLRIALLRRRHAPTVTTGQGSVSMLHSRCGLLAHKGDLFGANIPDTGGMNVLYNTVICPKETKASPP
jgi:hypothetical protein